MTKPDFLYTKIDNDLFQRIQRALLDELSDIPEHVENEGDYEDWVYSITVHVIDSIKGITQEEVERRQTAALLERRKKLRDEMKEMNQELWYIDEELGVHKGWGLVDPKE